MPPPNAYDQIHGTIEGELIRYVFLLLTAVRQRQTSLERLENLKRFRDHLREEAKEQAKKRNASPNADQEEEPKEEPITVPIITDTKTRSDRVEIKAETDKKSPEIGRSKAKNVFVDKKNVPPGPGQYTLSSDVRLFFRTEKQKNDGIV